MKKALIRIVLLVLLISMHVPAYAEVSEQAAQLNDSLVFAISNDMPAQISRLVYQAVRRMGYSISVESNGIASCLSMADNGEVDGVVALAAGMEVDYPNLVRISESLNEVRFVCYVRKGDQRKVSGWGDLSGLRVAVQYQKVYIEQHLPKDVASVARGYTVDELFQMLDNGNVDIVVMTSYEHGAQLLKKGFELSGIVAHAATYSYLHKRLAAVAEPIAQSLREMKADGSAKKILSSTKLRPDEKSVLHISSYDAAMEWERELTTGINNSMKERSDVQTYSVHLNANRALSPINRSSAVMDSIRNSFLSDPPDVVIVSDDEALQFVEDNYTTLLAGVPVIFCGINRTPEEIVDMASYARGVFETPSAAEVLEQMLTMYPKSTHLYVINDYTRSGRAWQAAIERSLAKFEGEMDITYNANVSAGELYRQLGMLGPDSLVLSGCYVVDKEHDFFTAHNIQKALAQRSNAPIFGLQSTTFGYGQVGGCYVSAEEQGRMAGQMVLSLLEGAPLESIASVENTKSFNQWRFDYNVLNAEGLGNQPLPNGSQLVNRPISFKEQNPTGFALAAVGFAVLLLLAMCISVAAALINNKNKQLLAAQKDMHTSDELLSKEREVQRVRERLQKTLQSAPLAYVMSVEGVTLESNVYSQERLNLYPGDRVERLFRSGGSLNDIQEELRAQGVIEGRVVHFVNLSGFEEHFLVNMVRVDYQGQEAAVMWGVDIQQIELQKERMARVEQDLNRALESMPMPVAIYDVAGDRLLFGNREFLSVFRCEEEDIPSFRLEDYSSDADQTADIGEFMRECMVTSGPNSTEYTFKRQDGSLMPSVVIASRIEFERIDCLILCVKDITQQQMHTKALVRLAEQEKKAHQSKARFLRSMSHEIQSPIKAIVSYAQMGMIHCGSIEDREVYKRIVGSAEGLLSSMNSILDYTDIEAGKLKLRYQEFSLADVMEWAMEMCRLRLEGKSVRLWMEMGECLPDAVVGDRAQVLMVLKHLMDNAAKFTQRGYVSLIAMLEDSQREDEVKIRLVVSDTGIGMNRMQLEQAFVPFEQMNKRLDEDGAVGLDGFGLGLPLVKQLVERMGGEVEVTSEEGKGTTATVILPFIRP